MRTTHPDSPWTQERINLLRVLWTQGYSARQIAMKLGGGISRNAVIGKRLRLGIPNRREPNRTYVRRPKPCTVSMPKRPNRPPMAPDKAPAVKPKAPVRGPTSVRFIDRDWSQCPMFCAGEDGALGFVCGAPMLFPEQTFCEECSKLIFTPALPARARRAA